MKPFFGVASFLDAWIEIEDGDFTCKVYGRSHPSWMRGLKYFVQSFHLPRWSVASFLDAWIEIILEKQNDTN